MNRSLRLNASCRDDEVVYESRCVGSSRLASWRSMVKRVNVVQRDVIVLVTNTTVVRNLLMSSCPWQSPSEEYRLVVAVAARVVVVDVGDGSNDDM